MSRIILALTLACSASAFMVPGKVFKVYDLGANADLFPITLMASPGDNFAGLSYYVMVETRASITVRYFGSNMFGIEGAAFREQQNMCRDVTTDVRPTGKPFTSRTDISCYVTNWVEQAPGRQTNIVGGVVRVALNESNRGNTTLSVNAFPPSPVVKHDNSPQDPVASSMLWLTGGEMRAGQLHTLVFDGLRYQLLD